MKNGCSQQPSCLYQICLDYLCNNLDFYCTLSPVSGLKKDFHKYDFKDTTIRFNHMISEDLLKRLCDLDKLNDLTLSLFASNNFNFKKFSIKKSNVSKEVLKMVLKYHQIDELMIHNLPDNPIISINDLIDSLNERSRDNLHNLNVSRNKSIFASIITNLDSLKNLTKLNVSFTCFNNLCLDIVCQDLIHLDYLDISATKVSELAPLTNLKDKIKFLYMYNMRASLGDDIIKVVTSFSKLQNLDVSCDVSTKIFSDMSLSLFDVNQLMDELTFVGLSDLKYLDISGKLGIKQESLMSLLRAYPDLKFLGLALTNANSFDLFNNHSNTFHTSLSSPSLISLQRNLIKSSFRELNLTDLVVTGESTEAQIISSLKYYKHRPAYIQKALYNLFALTRSYDKTRSDLVQIVVDTMLFNIKIQAIQLAASTCIYNLTRQNLYLDLPPQLLTQLINTILVVMLNYPNTLILQKNCLIVLCNESMLNNCTFNKFECIKSTLDCLNNFKDQTTINSSIAICAQVSLNAEFQWRKQFKRLTDPKYLKNLLSIISSHMRHLGNIENDESIIHSILDIIFYLSEENIDWCRNFVTYNGLNIYSDLMHTFENDLDAQFKLMSLIYKLSEIAEIRPVLFVHPIVKSIKGHVYHDDLNLKFLSMGFIANFLAYMPDTHWDWGMVKFDDFRFNLKPKIEFLKQNWKEELNLMIEFKQLSLDYLIKLSKMQHEPFVQMWSLWAINVFYRLNLTKDSSSCMKNIFNRLKTDSGTQFIVKKFCTEMINFV